MATLAGLEFLKIQESARHNKATEQEAAAARQQSYTVAREDRESRERINQASLDNAVSVQKLKSQSDIDKEKVRADASRYNTDMQTIKNNPFLSTATGFALAAERLGSGNWGDGGPGSQVKQTVGKAVDTFNDLVGGAINQNAVQPLSLLKNVQTKVKEEVKKALPAAKQKVEDTIRNYIKYKFGPYSNKGD